MGVVNKNMRASRVAFAHIFVDHGALAFVVLCGVLVRRHLDKAFSGAQKACLVSRRDEAVLRLLCALIRACAPGRRRTTLTAQTEGRTEGSTDSEAHLSSTVHGQTVFPRVASRANMLYLASLAARTHTVLQYVDTRLILQSALREFCKDPLHSRPF